METRPTKQNIDSIETMAKRIRISNLKILEEQKKTNELLKRLIDLLEEDARRTRIKMGH